MKPCSRSPEHSRPKIWRNSEDSVAAFGHGEGRSPAGVRFFAGGQVIVSYGVIRAALTYLQHVRYPFISDLKSTLQTPV
jgi:hypothetical protein